jgi:hypothetical protein
LSDVGHNGGVDRETYLKHQATAIIMAEKKSNLNAEVSRARKQAKADGVELGDLDFTIKAMSWTVGEIAVHFKRRLAYLAHNNINIGDVEKLFGVQTEDQRYAGVMAGMQGKVCSPPANLTPNEKQTWIEGWHEGNKARDGAQFDLVEREQKAAAALAAKAAVPDASTEAAQTLGGDDYGDDPPPTEGQAAPTAAAEPEPDTPPHQPKKPRVKKTPDLASA